MPVKYPKLKYREGSRPHFHLNDKEDDPAIARIRREARRRAIYEKTWGRSWQQKEMAEYLRPGRRIKYCERTVLKKNQVVIPGHRRYCIDDRGIVYAMCGRSRRRMNIPLEICLDKRPKKSNLRGYEYVPYVRLPYKDVVTGHTRTGDEIIVDQYGDYKYKLSVLVMHLFGPDRPDDGRKYYIDFRDGNGHNVWVKNLFWAPISERFRKMREAMPIDVWDRKGKKISEKGRENMRVKKGARR